jgi:3,4-dehydroadipyl-CoA semialdehyde dehydrogenase
LFDPILGTELVRVDATGIDLPEAFRFAREEGGAALRALTYKQRAALLAQAVKVLQANRDAYYDIATANSGTVKNDTAVDVDGGIFTLGTYAKLGDGLGDVHHLTDGDAARLGKDPLFQSQHVQVPTRGVALFINAFNFASWGLWEKAAPALLSGVPVIVKPATSTAWLTQRMVKDVVDAGIFPVGALSIICGSSAGLLDQLQPFDVVSFTGSADTAAVIRSHPAVVQRSVRVNIEADSVNSALLLPSANRRRHPGRVGLAGERSGARNDREIGPEVHRHPPRVRARSAVRGRCRRHLGPPGQNHRGQPAQRSGAHGRTGQPHTAGCRARRPGPAESPHRRAARRQPGHLHRRRPRRGLLHCAHAAGHPQPGRLRDRARRGSVRPRGHPHALPHHWPDDIALRTLIRRGQGSLVASLYGTDPAALSAAALELADSHGRVHVISPDVAALQTGHGNVMPQSLHGGPGRAGGGEELGGLKALNFYHRRSAIQASTAVLGNL